MKKWFLFSIMIFITLAAHAQSEPLPVDQVFQFSATAKDHQTIIVQWKIKPGYYLYRDRFQFRGIKPKNIRFGKPLFPQSIKKSSPQNREYQIYKKRVRIPIPIIIQTKQQHLILQVTYQGCSDKGYCYPPTTKVVPINLAGHYMQFTQGISINVPGAEGKPLSEQTRIETLLNGNNLIPLIIAFLGFGILISLTPCVLPMIPILAGIIVGHAKLSTVRSLLLALAYVLGMAITYAIAGIILGFIGSNLQATLQKPWIIVIFSLIFVAMALSLFGFYNIQLPEKWRSSFSHASQKQKSGTYVGAALMGCLSTLILSPCVTPPLVAVLSYIGHTGNTVMGGVALFAMGIGMGVPLLIIGAFGTKLLPKTGPWMNATKYILGILLLGIAIWMLERILPGAMTMLLWAALVIGTALYMGALSTAQSKWQLFLKGIGLIFFVYGILLIIGAATGRHNPLSPISLNQKYNRSMGLKFISVKTVSDVERELTQAKQQKKMALLDFYADWCISCKEMDEFTFNHETVKQQLVHFVKLRANVTANDIEDKALEKYFNVIAPPTILFFDKNGNEIKNARIVGKISAHAFLKHLNRIILTKKATTF